MTPIAPECGLQLSSFNKLYVYSVAAAITFAKGS
jgi:hypothetical protein